ncbi:hypothetical protein [Nocardioides speluncae]|uniref:hypothetical protein n=1 Tax=Nocardioides speluncae TaxID=2670337 RepID=UPI000D695820|nr:hypothetical protein [Nocardioides speluncae]
MRSRLLDAGLLAFPRGVRDRDGDHLRDLAHELADDHGITREVLGLVRGGLGERARRVRRSRRTMLAVGALTGLVLTLLTATAAAAATQFEDEEVTQWQHGQG